MTETTKIHFVGGPNRRITNPRWRTAAILKNRKRPYLHNGLTDLHKIWHDDAFWPSEGYGQLKFPTFENPRWQTAISPERLDQPARNLTWWCKLALHCGRIAKIPASYRKIGVGEHDGDVRFLTGSHGLVNSAMGQIPCFPESISCYQ